MESRSSEVAWGGRRKGKAHVCQPVRGIRQGHVHTQTACLKPLNLFREKGGKLGRPGDPTVSLPPPPALYLAYS